MKKLPAFLIILLAFLMVVPSDLHADKRRDVKGTIFRDPNGNNRLDNNEKGGESATVWLYRVLPNGKKRKVGRVNTDQAGNYNFKNVPAGKYFIAVRYDSNKLAVRTRNFNIGGGSNAPYNANVPFVTPATINKYPRLTATPNPDNLDDDGSNIVSPPAP
jgi:hypothetical protein